MGSTFLSWNIPNWITVVLMVALGYLVVSLVYTLIAGGGQSSIQGWFTPNGQGASGTGQ